MSADEKKIGTNGAVITKIFSIIISLFPILMFFIPLQVRIDPTWVEEGSKLIINGFESVLLGSTMIPMWWGEDLAVISAVNAVILIASVIMFVFNFVILKKDDLSKKIYNISCVITAILCVLYCVEGVLLVKLFDPYYEPKTFAYLALIFVVLIVLSRIYLKKKSTQQ